MIVQNEMAEFPVTGLFYVKRATLNTEICSRRLLPSSLVGIRYRIYLVEFYKVDYFIDCQANIAGGRLGSEL